MARLFPRAVTFLEPTPPAIRFPIIRRAIQPQPSPTQTGPQTFPTTRALLCSLRQMLRCSVIVSMQWVAAASPTRCIVKVLVFLQVCGYERHERGRRTTTRCAWTRKSLRSGTSEQWFVALDWSRRYRRVSNDCSKLRTQPRLRPGEQFDVRHDRYSTPLYKLDWRADQSLACSHHSPDHVPCGCGYGGSASAIVGLSRSFVERRRKRHRARYDARATTNTSERRRIQQQHVVECGDVGCAAE